MADTYDEFEQQLNLRLETIAQEIRTAQQQGREALRDPSDKLGPQLAAAQIKIKRAERARVGAMLNGIIQQKSELSMSNFTKQYVSLMQKSSKSGAQISEKHVNSVVRAYEDKLSGTHAVGSILLDSSEDALEATVEAGADTIGGDTTDYTELFGVEEAAAPDPAPPTRDDSQGASGGVAELDFMLPDPPTADPARAGAKAPAEPKTHRRTPSLTGPITEDLSFMLN